MSRPHVVPDQYGYTLVQVLRNVFREIDEKSNKSISMEDLQAAVGGFG